MEEESAMQNFVEGGGATNDTQTAYWVKEVCEKSKVKVGYV